MLKSVRLKNFQSHKDTELELGKLTLFTGGSNSGKSAATRALIGLLKNDAVDSFVTWDGSKNLEVEFVFEDGNKVRWIKGGGKNGYELETPLGEVQKYENVGAGNVPEDVAEVLRLTPLVMEDGKKSHVNVHAQLEAPFLISGTAGEAARMLGELTAASKIFTAVSEGNRRTKAANAKKKLRREDLIAVRQQLENFDSLDDDLALLAEVEELEAQLQTVGKNLGRLRGLRHDYVRVTNETAEAKQKLAELKPLVELDLTALTQSADRLARLSTLRNEYEDATTKIAKLTRLKQPLADAANVEGLDEALVIAQKVERIGTLCANYSGAQSTRAELLEKQAKLAKATAFIDKSLTEAYAELTECPSCGQELSADEAKDHLLKEVA